MGPQKSLSDCHVGIKEEKLEIHLKEQKIYIFRSLLEGCEWLSPGAEGGSGKLTYEYKYLMMVKKRVKDLRFRAAKVNGSPLAAQRTLFTANILSSETFGAYFTTFHCYLVCEQTEVNPRERCCVPHFLGTGSNQWLL